MGSQPLPIKIQNGNKIFLISTDKVTESKTIYMYEGYYGLLPEECDQGTCNFSFLAHQSRRLK